MNKVELIKAEIERRYKNNKADGYTLVCEELDDLLSFIDSLEEEPASDDLEKAAEEYVEKIRDLGNSTAHPQFNCHDAERLFILGGKWQKQQIMKSALDGTAQTFLPFDSVRFCGKPLHKRGMKTNNPVKVIIIKED